MAGDETELMARFHPERVLDDLRDMFRGVFGATRVGVARLAPETGRFENLATWDADPEAPAPHRFFARTGTAASWVVDSDCPVTGESVLAMNPFPSTQAYLMRYEYASNLLVPLALDRFGSGVLYLLSRTPGAFTMQVIPVGQRVRDVVEPALRTYLAARELLDGADDASVAGAGVLGAGRSRDGASTSGEGQPTLTLDDVQRRHIEDVLTRTNWIIDGPVGAAEQLGVRPSTLRHRMQKLGIRRPARTPRRG